MRFLLDTHLVVWAVAQPDRLSPVARGLIERPENDVYFSVVAIWEVAIKSRIYTDQSRHQDFHVDAALLRRRLLEDGFLELLVTSEHAIATSSLPAIHKDPFDRLLIAQAEVEGMTLVTSDAMVAKYHVPYLRYVQKV